MIVKSLPGTVVVPWNSEGILWVEPLHEVGLRLNLSPDEMHKFLKKHKLPVTAVDGVGIGLSDKEVTFMEETLRKAGKNE